MQTIIALAIGYLIAAGLYGAVSLNLVDTDWGSFTTYRKIISGWFLAVLSIIALWSVVAFCILMAGQRK